MPGYMFRMLPIPSDCSSSSESAVSAYGWAGVQYVAAPVFGRPDAVLAKKIVNVIAGAEVL